MLIMLYDGLIQSAEKADTEMSVPDNCGDKILAAQSVTRCIDIITELNSSLNHGVDASLCSTLSDLYRFFVQELSGAFSQCEPGRIRNILPLIRELRNAWFEADRKANRVQFAAA